MVAEIIIFIMALTFLIVGILLLNGKCSWLIAGYNNLSQNEKNKYNKKKICKAFGCICIVCFVMLCIMGYMGYRVDSGLMKEEAIFHSL